MAFFRHKVEIEILSNEKINLGDMSLEDIDREISQGDLLGTVEVKTENHEISKEVCNQLMLDFGNDGTFFDTDEDDGE